MRLKQTLVSLMMLMASATLANAEYACQYCKVIEDIATKIALSAAIVIGAIVLFIGSCALFVVALAVLYLKNRKNEFMHHH